MILANETPLLYNEAVIWLERKHPCLRRSATGTRALQSVWRRCS